MKEKAKKVVTETLAVRTVPRAKRRWNSAILIPAAVAGLIVVMGLLGPFFIDYDPVKTTLADRLLSPGSNRVGGEIALLGTDHLGRDIWAQIVYGSRTSVIVGACTVAIAVFVGVVVGVPAGYFGGWFDIVIRRLIDVTIAVPAILLAILIAAVFAGSLFTIVIAIAITAWIGIARVSRASALSIVERPWIDAARMLGTSHLRTILRHVLPFVVGPVIALATVEFALAVLAEAGLSFLGIGLPMSTPSWGQTIANGRDYLGSAWWISAFPGAVLAVFVVSVGLLGDALSHRYGKKFNTI